MRENSLDLIQEFLSKKRIAVVGVSRQAADFSRMLFRDLAARGYDVVPVNAKADGEIEKRPAARRLAEVSPAPEAVLVMTPDKESAQVLEQAAAAGVTLAWLYAGATSGAVSPEAVATGKRLGLRLVVGECPFMFLPSAGWIHGLHGLFRKVTGSYPLPAGPR